MGSLATYLWSRGLPKTIRCGPCFCRCCTRSGAIVSWWSSWSTTCCTAGLWGLDLDDAVFSVSAFTKNRDRLLTGEIAAHFFSAVLAEAESEGLVSSEHFTVDGTLIEAWASHKSFVEKGGPRNEDDDDPGNPTVNYRGRSGATRRTRRRQIPRQGSRRSSRKSRAPRSGKPLSR